MTGLYAFKPWYAARLAPVRRLLASYAVAPTAVSWAGVAFAAAGGTALAVLPPGPLAAAAVAIAVAARLACANLDGGLARAAGRATAAGTVANEVTDRIADLAVLAGLAAHAPLALAAVALLAASAPSWVALAGAAAGAPRVQGGPVGKTERAALAVVAAATGAATVVAAVVAAGSLLTAVRRGVRVHRLLAAGGAR